MTSTHDQRMSERMARRLASFHEILESRAEQTGNADQVGFKVQPMEPILGEREKTVVLEGLAGNRFNVEIQKPGFHRYPFL
jgi:hypothetical protein